LAEAAGTLHGSAAAEMKRRKWVHDGQIGAAKQRVEFCRGWSQKPAGLS
jgi:hypothetical protein